VQNYKKRENSCPDIFLKKNIPPLKLVKKKKAFKPMVSRPS
jgi:hypothetical protein